MKYRVDGQVVLMDGFSWDIEAPNSMVAKAMARSRAYGRAWTTPDIQEVSINSVVCVDAEISQPRPTQAAPLLEALLTIAQWAQHEGRWVEFEDGSTVGFDKETPGSGYYDAFNPPDGYDQDGWCGPEHERPKCPLKPAEWAYYSQYEARDRLQACAEWAKQALEKAGVLQTTAD